MQAHPLIAVDELASLVAAGGCTVLDVRYRLGGPPGAEEFARGHIPVRRTSTWTAPSPARPANAAAIRSPMSTSSRRRCAQPG